MSTKEIKVYSVVFNSAIHRYLVMVECGSVAAQCVYYNDANKVCEALNNDSQVQALKADLERLVKMYGSFDNWQSVVKVETSKMVYEIIDQKDLTVLSEKYPDDKIGGKLAREIGDKWRIKYE